MKIRLAVREYFCMQADIAKVLGSILQLCVANAPEYMSEDRRSKLDLGCSAAG
jgi:hypothetical protein